MSIICRVLLHVCLNTLFPNNNINHELVGNRSEEKIFYSPAILNHESVRDESIRLIEFLFVIIVCLLRFLFILRSWCGILFQLDEGGAGVMRNEAQAG